MNLILKATHITISPALDEYIETTLRPLAKLVDGWGEVEARVEVGRSTFHHKKGEVFFAEANLSFGKHLLRARSEAFSVPAALDEVKDELKNEIFKFKGKKETVFRRSARSISKLLRLSPLARFRRKE